MLSGCVERHHSLLYPPSSLGAPVVSTETTGTSGASEDVGSTIEVTQGDSAEGRPHHIEAGEEYAFTGKTRIGLRSFC